jgi:hypothetical protein
MRISPRSHPALVLIDGYIARLRYRRSPIVSQAELVLLLQRDRSDVNSRLRIEDSLRRRPHRGAYATPQKTLAEWRDFVASIDEGIAYLQDRRSIAELEAFVREWQQRRKAMEETIWRWNRGRADVIPVYLDADQGP